MTETTPGELTTGIRGGIEWIATTTGDEAACARCGSSADYLTCDNRGGGGECCDCCDGTGGSWHCLSSPTWCEAHPIAGREHIQSTALNQEAWNG